MTKYLIVFAMVLILFAWTAVRYRKQIAGMIGFVRMIRDAANPNRTTREMRERSSVVPNELVNCVGCRTWIPSDRAIRFDAKTYYCSKECVQNHLQNSQ
jgi:hypothetical protein